MAETSKNHHATGRWTMREHAIFVEAVQLYRNQNWRQISAMVGTRSPEQVRTHAQKYFQKINRRIRARNKVQSIPEKLSMVYSPQISPLNNRHPMFQNYRLGQKSLLPPLYVALQRTRCN